MPELPDVTVYVECIEAKLLGRKIERVRIASPFVARSVDPPMSEVEGKTVRDAKRIGKRIAIGLDDDLWIVIHLMIAGRFRWLKPGAKLPGRWREMAVHGGTWRYMADMGNRARCVDRRFREFDMPATRRITVRGARPRGDCWRTARCRDC